MTLSDIRGIIWQYAETKAALVDEMRCQPYERDHGLIAELRDEQAGILDTVKGQGWNVDKFQRIANDVRKQYLW